MLALFGIMNWLYTWYNAKIDPEADVLAREIGDVFLQGIRGGGVSNRMQGGSTGGQRPPRKPRS